MLNVKMSLIKARVTSVFVLLKKTQQQPTSFYRTVAPAPCSPPYPPPPLHFSEIKFDFSPPGQRGRAGGRDGGGGENCHAPPPPLASPFNLRREGGKGRPRLNKRRRRRRGEKWGGKEREGRRSKSRERFMGMSFFPLTPSLPAFSIWRIFLFRRRNFFF